MTRVIFVPGIKGTELFNGENKVWLPKTQNDLDFLRMENKLRSEDPIGIFNAVIWKFNIYKRIVDKLKGWFPSNAETFGYDWRDDAKSNSEILVEEIKDLYSKNNVDEKVTIVAHSMGGIIAKLAIFELNKQGLIHLVDKLITIGTPWLGAPDALKVLSYGENGIFRGTDTISQFMDDSRMMELSRQYPSAYQLLPNKAYYDQPDGKYVRTVDKKEVSYQDIISKVKTFFNCWDEENKVFKNIDVWTKYVAPIHKAMLSPLPDDIEHECIIGVGEPTLYGLSMESEEKRKEFKGEFAFKNGDGVVPLISAIPIDGSKKLKKYYVRGEHAYLCSNKKVIKIVENILLGDTKTLPNGVTTYEPENSELKKGKLAIIKCPVDSTILDNEGAYVAGVFDPSKEVSEFVTEEKVNYFTIGNSKFIFIEDNCNEDLSFDIRAYDDGITDVSVKIFEKDKTTELDFASIPMTSKSSAKLLLPLSGDDIVDKATVIHNGEETKKTVRTYEAEPIIIDEKLSTIKVQIKEASEQVKRIPYNPIYNGNVILEVKSLNNTDVTQNAKIKEVMYAINNEPAKTYEGPVELKSLKNGENRITVIGKDVFNRPLKSIEKKVYLDIIPPKTTIKLLAEPDGLIAIFTPETQGSKAETQYRFSYSWESDTEIEPETEIESTTEIEPETEWKVATAGQEVAIPWKKVKDDPEQFISIEYFSKNEFGVVEQLTREIKVKVGKIPALMWSEVSTTSLTPKMILSNILYEHPNFLDDEIKMFALMGERKKDNLYSLENDEVIKDNVKGVRFSSTNLIMDVMFAEPYSLYFSGPPSEVLRKNEKYKFKFELITDRTKERVNYTNPKVTLRKNVKKQSTEEKIRIPLEELNGIYYGEFTVDETFKEDKHKLVITDNKNSDPALRLITLIMDEVEAES
ncbi:hypothetical protein P4576_22740 [Peribacillus frigoritolerans]|uniref:lipase/acyltransferase domain-containing protein n=1 Tax=Peribacillus frigoritolerans TaxID=450367 RepID=UPI002E1CCC55|nr:hypothetical protein [Peribacillus frigoritolerans]